MTNLHRPHTVPMAVLALLLPLIHVAVVFAGKCCESVSPAPQCSGCVPLGADYVNLGSNAVSRCKTVEQPLACEEADAVCATLIDAPRYDSGCVHMVGTVTVEIIVPQCGNGDSSCSAG